MQINKKIVIYVNKSIVYTKSKRSKVHTRLLLDYRFDVHDLSSVTGQKSGSLHAEMSGALTSLCYIALIGFLSKKQSTRLE